MSVAVSSTTSIRMAATSVRFSAAASAIKRRSSSWDRVVFPIPPTP
jgi:hypothetical protein